MFQMKTLTVGMLGTCCYILWDDTAESCAVIDPGDEPERIREACEGRRIEAILLTHGHFDHIGGVKELAKDGAEIVIHREDAPMLVNPELNACGMIGQLITAPKATRLIREGETLHCAGLTLTVLHTPGHTPGGVCYQVGDALFTGDTLFHGGYGRTDLPGGSMRQLADSLRRLSAIVPGKDIYPGH